MIGLKDLVRALRRGAPDKNRCVGCGYEHDCSIHGCRLMNEAASRLEHLQISLQRLDKTYESAKGAERALLGEVLELLNGEQGSPERIETDYRYVHDFELCDDATELARTLKYIDRHGYVVVSATQDASGMYTVIFRRPACGSEVGL